MPTVKLPVGEIGKNNFQRFNKLHKNNNFYHTIVFKI